MTFAARDISGPAVSARSRGRRLPLARSQALNRRHMLWLFATEVGLPDPVTGQVRPYTTTDLAKLFGCGIRAVQLGIKQARALRDYCDSLTDID